MALFRNQLVTTATAWPCQDCLASLLLSPGTGGGHTLNTARSGLVRAVPAIPQLRFSFNPEILLQSHSSGSPADPTIWDPSCRPQPSGSRWVLWSLPSLFRVPDPFPAGSIPVCPSSRQDHTRAQAGSSGVGWGSDNTAPWDPDPGIAGGNGRRG